jgi:hypothetical protein
MKQILLGLGFIIAAVAVVFFGLWILSLALAILVFFGIVWVCGVPITITKDGKQIGYYRWTKFYPKR